MPLLVLRQFIFNACNFCYSSTVVTCKTHVTYFVQYFHDAYQFIQNNDSKYYMVDLNVKYECDLYGMGVWTFRNV